MGSVLRGVVATAAVATLIVGTSVPASADNGAGDVPAFSAGGAVQHPLIDADGKGRGTATWIRIGRERQAWTSDFDGRTWTCPKVLPGSTGALGFVGASWDLAEAPNGAAVLGGSLNSDGAFEGAAVWTRAAAGKPWVQVRWSDPGSFAVGQAEGPPSVALTGSVALIAWVAQDAQTSHLYAAKIPVGSNAKVTPTLIYSKSMKGTMDTDPDVGIDAQGNALIQFEDWVDYDYPLFLTRWPAGGAPTTAVLKADVETKEYLTSLHVNAAGQVISSWGYAPDGAPEYQQWVGFGNSIAGITSEGVWQSFGSDGAYYYPDTMGSDIDDAGNAALMLIYDNQLIGGLGNVNAGLGSITPRAVKQVAHGGEHWDVTVQGGRAIVALSTSDGASILEELIGSEFVNVVTLPDTTAVDSAFVTAAGTRRPAMVGTNLGERKFRTSLPTRVRRC